MAGCRIAGCLGLLMVLLTVESSSALDWETNVNFRSARLVVPAVGRSGFTLLPESATGIAFTNHLADLSAALNQIRMNGSGVALGDVDGDGWCDIYLCRLEGPNQLYRNLGNWKFTDVTGSAGVACDGQSSTGAAFADLDGDGDLDLIVNSIDHGTRLFFNDGAGRFTERSNPAMQRPAGGMSLALADVDGDGDLDLYIANYRTNTIRSTGLSVLVVNGKRVIRPEDRDHLEFTPQGLLLEHAEADVLYLNDGRGNFTPVPWTNGIFRDEDGKPLAAAPRDWGLSAMFRDIDGDGAPDLYVCNDFWSPDRIWLNDGHGRFRAAPRLALRHTSTFSMGVDFADLDRDGRDDFLVLDMLSRDPQRRLTQRAMSGQNFNDPGRIDDRSQAEHNTLFWNRGDGTFAEIAPGAGLAASEWSWCPVFLDVDLDGYEDLLVTNGHDFDPQDVDTQTRIDAQGPQPAGQTYKTLLLYPRLNVPRCAFRNRGDLTFEEVSAAWGFNQVGVAHGMALADLDNDGDLDVVVNNLNGPAGIYRNESAAPRVAVRLRGLAPNTRGIGAKIKMLGGPVPQSQEMISGGRYLSCDEAARVFAAGKATNGWQLEVTWRNGSRSVIPDLQPNRIYEIAEAPVDIVPPRATPPAAPAPLFQDISNRIGHLHHEEPFDDFARQPLLSRRLSQLGPGVAWCDIDGDGWDDLLIGSGHGGRLAVFRNNGQGGFDSVNVGDIFGAATDDLTTIVGWPAASNTFTLLVGQANYETGNSNQPAVLRCEIANGAIEGKEALPGGEASTGPLALADVDGDGNLDLFVGGRVVPGRYPAATASRLYRNTGGVFQLAREWPGLGLVSGAVFGDLNGDGFPELILAGEWGPLRVFKNDRGQFKEATETLGLNKFSGWWNGVTTGDFDGDGRLDLIAANWGRNSLYQEFLRDEIRIVAGDLSGRGTFDFLEACLVPAGRRAAPWRDLEISTRAMPWLAERFPSAREFAAASLEQILGDRLKAARELRVNWLDTTLFLNRGDHFEARPLPWEAQLAPAFGVGVGDVDGDGNEDVFLSQNFFAVEEGTSRYDAGRGLWLRGDGQGNLSPVSGPESGVLVYGEQRGAALSDFDGDGRVDLVVTQNAAETKLFRNVAGQPGLRVRLRGPLGNVAGVGAVLRAHYGERTGPARELHAGSGYWSQDSLVSVLGGAVKPDKISVRWPGGRVTTSVVDPVAREIAIDFGGKATVLR